MVSNVLHSVLVSLVLICFANGVSSSRLRLTPSRFPRLNLVEVYHNGQWGTVLPNPFVPISPVGQVICRQLGYNNLTTATSAALLRSSRFDANLNEKIWLIVKTCDGTESDINACTLLPWGTAITDHRYDLLVRCSSCSVLQCQAGKSICSNNGTGTMCAECIPPYITAGWNRGCRTPTCVPTCGNNGTCIADNTCRCLAGFQGKRCELGGQLNEVLKPRLHVVEDDILSPLAWYKSPTISNNNRLCFVKIGVQVSSLDTILTAESLNSVDELYGNYSMGPIDAKAEVNGTTRVACLQVKCPTFDRNGNTQLTIVRVAASTAYGNCRIRPRVFKMQNVTIIPSSGGNEVLEFALQPGNNYGPYFGIYISQGYREKAKYIAERSCFCGRDYILDGINPLKNTLANYVCA